MHRHPGVRDHRLAAFEKPCPALHRDCVRPVRTLAPGYASRPKYFPERSANHHPASGLPAGHVYRVPDGFPKKVIENNTFAESMN